MQNKLSVLEISRGLDSSSAASMYVVDSLPATSGGWDATANHDEAECIINATIDLE